MEDFISVSEIEMMCVRGGFMDGANMYEVVVPYGIVLPPYGIEPPHVYEPLPPYGVVNPPF